MNFIVPSHLQGLISGFSSSAPSGSSERQILHVNSSSDLADSAFSISAFIFNSASVKSRSPREFATWRIYCYTRLGRSSLLRVDCQMIASDGTSSSSDPLSPETYSSSQALTSVILKRILPSLSVSPRCTQKPSPF